MSSDSVARIDLDAIVANLAAVRARVGQRRVLVAVKANGYGHGSVPVSRALEESAAADWLGVASVAEGLELRAAGIGLPILKFGPTRDDADLRAAIDASLTLTVVDAAGIDQVASVAAAQGQGPTPVHLKVDTGMRRVGCDPADAPGLADRVDASGSLSLEGLYSHLPISDHPSGDAFTAEQIARFASVRQAVEAHRGPVALAHLANSGAVLGHPDSWFDLVRPGVMSYGSYPDPDGPRTVPLRPALRWTTTISFVKDVAAAETVGYGRTWTAPADTRIATIPVGYGDGYSRLLSNRGRVLINDRSYPIAGRVCMDQTMIDLGPDATAEVGDEVVLIGRSGDEEITVAEIAALMGTISYEVTCLITGRVHRHYG